MPQRSVLGPVLFLIFIKDLPDIFNSKIKLFSGDATLYSKTKSDHIQINLREEQDKISTWTTPTWQMELKAETCKHMRIGRTNTSHNYTVTRHKKRRTSRKIMKKTTSTIN